MGRILGTILCLACAAGAETALDLGAAHLFIDERGYTRLEVPSAADTWPRGVKPIVEISGGSEVLLPESVAVVGDRITARFPGGGICELAARLGTGFAVFEVVRIEGIRPINRLRLVSVPLPPDTEILGTINAGRTKTHVVALSAAEPNVHAFTEIQGRSDSDRAGCTHELVQIQEAKVGESAARFAATCDTKPAGWSYSGRGFAQPPDLTGCEAIRAWVHGDGKGELLKIQLSDSEGGYRDDYIPITFEGWQQVTASNPALNTLRYGHVTGLGIYYNGMAASQTVTCLIDHIEAVFDRDGKEESVLLEDFEPSSTFWSPATHSLCLETTAAHDILPARFGLLVSPTDRFPETMEQFEAAAGLPSPKPGGVWNKQSPWVERSYLFITQFGEAQFDAVLELARRGGFDMILMGQESWAKATGHYEINTDHFPDGLEGLARTIQRFQEAGFHVGLHFLGPSIYPPDPYLTPVPDPRLVKDATAELAADIDEKADVVPTALAPETFPAEDGGYLGDGAILQIGNELIQYGTRSMEAPFGFQDCQRGILGTAAAPHTKSEPIAHVKKSYGYFLFDMDTSLLDEVSTNFARVANTCDIDMIYFDGSERLQGEHWYYNARLHKAFFDKLARKDILIQASSFSHYSWHILARSASADGHGDLKGYLDERSGAFEVFNHNSMPLDIGWYYGYDPSCPPDMFEYVLGATIGYNSSMSFQVSLDAASRHPFTGKILDLIARYEKLRLSGRVPEEMRARLRIDPKLAGQKSDEERAALLDLRREYRLLGEEGHEVFQHVVYDAWHDVQPTDPQTNSWSFSVKEGPAKIGVQFHVQPGPWVEAGPSYRDQEALVLESFDDLAPYLANQGDRQNVTSVAQGEGGATLQGVTQDLSLTDQDAKEGKCAVYSAESSLPENTGWSVIGKRFNPPLDLSWHKAIGFWLRGDGKGGLFKLQLLDGSKAADFYIANDYIGWRYQQLARPENDPIDYSHVTTLNLYYNGLPAKTAVSCAIDDIKALRNIDTQTVSTPWVEVDGHRLGWNASVSQGQYVFLWPGEPARCYGPTFREPKSDNAVTEVIELGAGEHTARFGCEGPLLSSIRARVTLQPPEKYEIP